VKKVKCPQCGFDVVQLPDNIGELLREERQKVGLKSKSVARHMGISGEYLSMLECGRRTWHHGFVHNFRKAIKALA
jgi:transcriptional regulator with XRE-family HTH domain